MVTIVGALVPMLASLYVPFPPVCHTGTSVVRRVVIALRHRPLTKDRSLRLGLKAAVLLAASTANHNDHPAQGLRRSLAPYVG